jgi:hypothetical protein
MSLDVAVLIGVAGFVAGALAGIVLRRRTIAQWVALGTLLVIAIGLALSIWVVTMGNPWVDGGTIEHYHAERVLSEPFLSSLVLIASLLFYLGPLPLGFVVGAAYAFRRERHGWLWFGLCCAGVPCLFMGSLWMAIVAGT